MKNRFAEIFKEIASDRDSNQAVDINSRVMIIDGLNTYIRVFSSVPALNDDGDHIGGIVGFMRSVAATIRQFKPTRCILVFDGKGGSARRRSNYTGYKANRTGKTNFKRHEEFKDLVDEQQSMRAQLNRVVQYLDHLPVTMMCYDHIEADDAIAYIANEILTSAENKVQIVSTDRDFLQLVNDRISVWSPVKKKLYTPAVMREEFGIDSRNYLTYRIFEGDGSDNIPGVKGISLKSLIKYFPMITESRHIAMEEIIEHAKQNSIATKYKIYSLVNDALEQIQLNSDLMQLKEVDIAGNIKLMILDKFNQPVPPLNMHEFKKMFMADKLYTVIKDVDVWSSTSFNTLNSYSKINNK
jgi:5'-3' exonuclease